MASFTAALVAILVATSESSFAARWSTWNSGLTTLPISALAIDPLNTNIVYAGAQGGVFAITVATAGPNES